MASRTSADLAMSADATPHVIDPTRDMCGPDMAEAVRSGCLRAEATLGTAMRELVFKDKRGWAVAERAAGADDVRRHRLAALTTLLRWHVLLNAGEVPTVLVLNSLYEKGLATGTLCIPIFGERRFRLPGFVPARASHGPFMRVPVSGGSSSSCGSELATVAFIVGVSINVKATHVGGMKFEPIVATTVPENLREAHMETAGLGRLFADKSPAGAAKALIDVAKTVRNLCIPLYSAEHYARFLRYADAGRKDYTREEAAQLQSVNLPAYYRRRKGGPQPTADDMAVACRAGVVNLTDVYEGAHGLHGVQATEALQCAACQQYVLVCRADDCACAATLAPVADASPWACYQRRLRAREVAWVPLSLPRAMQSKKGRGYTQPTFKYATSKHASWARGKDTHAGRVLFGPPMYSVRMFEDWATSMLSAAALQRLCACDARVAAIRGLRHAEVRERTAAKKLHRGRMWGTPLQAPRASKPAPPLFPVLSPPPLPPRPDRAAADAADAADAAELMAVQTPRRKAVAPGSTGRSVCRTCIVTEVVDGRNGIVCPWPDSDGRDVACCDACLLGDLLQKTSGSQCQRVPCPCAVHGGGFSVRVLTAQYDPFGLTVRDPSLASVRQAVQNAFQLPDTMASAVRIEEWDGTSRGALSARAAQRLRPGSTLLVSVRGGDPLPAPVRGVQCDRTIATAAFSAACDRVHASGHMLQDVACASWAAAGAGVSVRSAVADVRTAVARYRTMEQTRCHDGCRTLPCARQGCARSVCATFLGTSGCTAVPLHPLALCTLRRHLPLMTLCPEPDCRAEMCTNCGQAYGDGTKHADCYSAALHGPVTSDMLACALHERSPAALALARAFLSTRMGRTCSGCHASVEAPGIARCTAIVHAGCGSCCDACGFSSAADWDRFVVDDDEARDHRVLDPAAHDGHLRDVRVALSAMQRGVPVDHEVCMRTWMPKVDACVMYDAPLWELMAALPKRHTSLHQCYDAHAQAVWRGARDDEGRNDATHDCDFAVVTGDGAPCPGCGRALDVSNARRRAVTAPELANAIGGGALPLDVAATILSYAEQDAWYDVDDSMIDAAAAIYYAQASSTMVSRAWTLQQARAEMECPADGVVFSVNPVQQCVVRTVHMPSAMALLHAASSAPLHPVAGSCKTAPSVCDVLEHFAPLRGAGSAEVLRAHWLKLSYVVAGAVVRYAHSAKQLAEASAKLRIDHPFAQHLARAVRGLAPAALPQCAIARRIAQAAPTAARDDAARLRCLHDMMHDEWRMPEVRTGARRASASASDRIRRQAGGGTKRARSPPVAPSSKRAREATPAMPAVTAAAAVLEVPQPARLLAMLQAW